MLDCPRQPGSNLACVQPGNRAARTDDGPRMGNVITARSISPQRDVYVCAAGEDLTHRCTTEERGIPIRRYWINGCKTCPLRTNCPTGTKRRIARREREDLVDDVDSRLGRDPDGMTLCRRTFEHPFGTIRAWMGGTHFLMRRLKNMRGEMAPNVLAYSIKRMITLLGVGGWRAPCRGTHGVRYPRAARPKPSEITRKRCIFVTPPEPSFILCAAEPGQDGSDGDEAGVCTCVFKRSRSGSGRRTHRASGKVKVPIGIPVQAAFAASAGTNLRLKRAARSSIAAGDAGFSSSTAAKKPSKPPGVMMHINRPAVSPTF